MACQICSRSFDANREPICASCTSAVLYRPRVEQATVLLDKDNFHTHAEVIFSSGNDGLLASLRQDADWDAITTGIKKESVKRLQDELSAADTRLAELSARVQRLAGEVVRYRDHIDAQRSETSKRRQELVRQKAGLSERKKNILEPLDAAVRKSRQRVQRTHQRLADAKARLCCSAALLAGLKQEAIHRQSSTGRILLGGLTIPDLRELGSVTAPSPSRTQEVRHVEPEEHGRQAINACLDNICRLVLTWTHYLSISMPAEIVLPHNDFPHSAILPEKSSYKSTDLLYPGSQLSRTNSPSASRVIAEGQSTVRLRVLHLDRPLSKLVKEDAKAFGLFVEGVMLLAWDVAWLCKSQGITAINTFDEVCDIGRNLWLLYRAAESRSLEIKSNANTKASPSLKVNGTVQFGTLTHGSVLHSLAGHEGAQVLHNWRLLQPHRLVDKLRSYLLTELTGAEWDVLSEHDYDDEREDEVPVLVGGTARRKREENKAGMSVMSIGTGDAAIAAQTKHEKGWMKVRGRPVDG